MIHKSILLESLIGYSMLFDDFQKQLKSIAPDIKVIKQYWEIANIEEELKTLKKTTESESFWQNTNKKTILQKLQHLTQLKASYDSVTTNYEDLIDIVQLFQNENITKGELNAIAHDIRALQKNTATCKINFLLQSKDDNENCFLNINAGAGGTESQDWAEMLLRMYIRFCEREKLNASLIDYQKGEEAGIKSATIFIKGNKPFGFLKSEKGIHRLVRISPFDSNKRRHTSFAAVDVTPEQPDIQITINPSNLRIDTYRASGAGGQHVNKTDSAVRITHTPTNIVVQCQNERSQTQNKTTAMKMLHAKLAEKEKIERESEQSKNEKKKIEWGSQIRSYTLHPYKMVKDHRTNIDSTQPQLILDGDIIKFIEAIFSFKREKITFLQKLYTIFLLKKS